MRIECTHRCGLYSPGHDVHWIQAKLSARAAADPSASRAGMWAHGHLLEVCRNGFLSIEVDGRVRRLWNHDPDRLEQVVAHNLGEISHQPALGWLAPSQRTALFVLRRQCVRLL
jgi:hypothetical protein